MRLPLELSFALAVGYLAGGDSARAFASESTLIADDKMDLTRLLISLHDSRATITVRTRSQVYSGTILATNAHFVALRVPEDRFKNRIAYIRKDVIEAIELEEAGKK